MLETNRMDINSEGYRDPTAGKAYENIRREERRKEAETLEILGNLVKTIKRVAELAGFEVVGRIALKHKVTGKEYR